MMVSFFPSPTESLSINALRRTRSDLTCGMCNFVVSIPSDKVNHPQKNIHERFTSYPIIFVFISLVLLCFSTFNSLLIVWER